MKRPLLTSFMFLSSATLLIAGTGCTKPQTSTPAAGSGQIGVSDQAKVKAIWTCPMHPQIKKDSPGQCPICGMNLVLAEGGHDHSSAEIDATTLPAGHAPFQLSGPRQQMIGVKLGTAEKKPLFKTIEASGRVAFDPELYTAQNEYIEAVKQLSRVQDSPIAEVKHSAQRMVESAKLRLKILGLSDSQIRSLSTKESAGSSLLIPTPGENLWIYAEVFEMDLPSVQAGQSVKISGGSLGAQEIPGKVVSVDRVINPNTRAAKVRIQALSSRTNLRPEAFVNATILSPLDEQITVPFDAVLDTGKEAWVFVAGPNGTFNPRKVTIKFRAGDEVAIAGGLSDGEKIVTSANFLIDSESRLKAVQIGSGSSEGEKPKAPECPKGQFWHAEMKHCMVEPGK